MNNVHLENKKISRCFFWFIWFVYVVVYMTKNCFSAALASIVYEGAMTKSQTGIIMAAFQLVYAPLQLVGGVVADRYDPEKLIKIGLLGGSIANLIIFFNQNYYVILVTWILNAVVQFAVWPSVFKIVSSQLVKEDRKSATYFLSFSSVMGLLFAYFVAAFLTKWEYNFLISSVSLFVLFVAVHIVTRCVSKYMLPSIVTEDRTVSDSKVEYVPTLKLFLESGILILVAVAFIRTLVANSINTLSATMLMESYENVSPSLGNILNIFILGASVMGTVLVKTVLYPKYIKSAPNGMVVMFIITLAALLLLMLVGNLNIVIAVVMLCVVAGCLNAIFLLTTYCNLRFEKFNKSGTVAGIINAASSIGILFSSYGITKLAEVYDWTVVKIVFLVLTAVALFLCCAMIPFWKRFKKKYHPHALQPLVKN